MNPLISAAELREWLGQVTVLDVRYRMVGPSGPEEYVAGHVPGAAYVDLDADLADPPGRGGRHPLPDEVRFEVAMRRAGVSLDRPVVVYDDWDSHAAARAWWLLRFHGHPDVRVLDGGWRAWWEAGGDLERGDVTPAPGDFAVSPEKGMPMVTAEEVLDVPVLVDGRAPERWRGEVEPIDPVAGRIPGAVNVPTARNLDDAGCFLAVADLQAVYADVGIDETSDVAAYCGSGVTATHDVLAMAVAGIPAALYPGSWSEWITDPARPVERSDPPTG